MDRSKLMTERRNKRSADIDIRSTQEIVDIINAEDRKVADAVGKERRSIAAAAEMIVTSFREGGRLFYVGAGTSGRLGVLDAAECPPTFGTKPGMVQGIIAGGRRALVKAKEGAEDDADAGVVGIATSGVTPFVRGAMKRARARGAGTVFVTCSPEAAGGTKAEVTICVAVGPEVVTGSTRMKAGTATKLVLNTLTTTAMIRTGKVYGNLMVDLRAGSKKLRDRAERIVMTVTGLRRAQARALLARARGQVKVAIVMHALGVDSAGARRRLRACGGFVRRAIEED